MDDRIGVLSNQVESKPDTTPDRARRVAMDVLIPHTILSDIGLSIRPFHALFQFSTANVNSKVIPDKGSYSVVK